MKRIINLALIVALFTISPYVFGQTQTPVTKAAFVSSVKQFNNYITAKQTDKADAELKHLMEMMKQRMRDGQDEYGTVSTDAQRKAIGDRLTQEKTLYAQIWKMSKKLEDNLVDIKADLKAFSNTF